MRVELIKTEKFYPTMQRWWKGQNFPDVSPSMLPENTLVCYNEEDNPTYSVCFYNTDSNLAWLGWEIANPELSSEQKKGGLEFLFKAACKLAENLGYQVVFTTSKTPAIKANLEKSGFVVGDEDVNHYIKTL